MFLGYLYWQMYSTCEIWKDTTLGRRMEREPGQVHEVWVGLVGPYVMARPPPAPQCILRGVGAAVNTLHFSCDRPDPPLLFSGSTKGAVHIWNLNTRRPENVLDGHGGSSVIWVNTLDRETVLSQGRDMRVCLWPLAEGRGDVSDSLYTGSVGFCQCSLLSRGPSSSLLAYASEQMEEVKVLELSSKVPLCSLKPDKKLGMVMCLKIWQPDSGEGPLLVAGYEDGSVLLWDVSLGRPLNSLRVHPEPVMSLAFDPDRQRGASGSAENTIRSWALDGQRNLQQRESVELLNPGISQLCVRGDGKILASAGWDHQIRVFGWKKLKPLAVLKCHTDMVLSVTFSDHTDPAKRVMAAGSKDQRISVWSIYNQS